jgi:hypothetical protein
MRGPWAPFSRVAELEVIRLPSTNGRRATNTTAIVFDTNDPIATNAVWNTVGYARSVFVPVVQRDGRGVSAQQADRTESVRGNTCPGAS